MAVHDRPDVYDRHDVWRVERMLLTAAALIFALSCLLIALWLTMSEPKTKLYEADNMPLRGLAQLAPKLLVLLVGRFFAVTGP